MYGAIIWSDYDRHGRETRVVALDLTKSITIMQDSAMHAMFYHVILRSIEHGIRLANAGSYSRREIPCILRVII